MCPRSTMLSGLDVDCEAMYVLESFADRFIDRRMRMNRVHHALHRGFRFHCRYGFANQFERLGADDVDTQYLAEFFVRNHLHEAFVFAENCGLAVAHERKLSDLDPKI